jgi:hypothetical protein
MMILFIQLVVNQTVFWTTFSSPSEPLWQQLRSNGSSSSSSSMSVDAGLVRTGAAGTSWFGPVPLSALGNSTGAGGAVAAYYSFTLADITTLWAMGAYGGTVAFPFAAWTLAQPTGLRTAMRTASVLMALGCFVRMLPSFVYLGALNGGSPNTSDCNHAMGAATAVAATEGLAADDRTRYADCLGNDRSTHAAILTMVGTGQVLNGILSWLVTARKP